MLPASAVLISINVGRLRHMLIRQQGIAVFPVKHGISASPSLVCTQVDRKIWTRNTLDCDQSNYSSRTVFPTYLLNSVKPEIAPFDPPTPKTPPQNQTWSGSDNPLWRLWPFEFSQMWGRRSLVGRWSPVGPQYILLLTLISYTPLRYVRNVAHEE